MGGMTVGSILGGYIPTLFGVDFFSIIPIFTTALGGLLGVWLMFKLTS